MAGRGSLTSHQIAGSYSVSRLGLFCKRSHEVINSLPPFFQKCPSVPLRQHTSNLVWFQLSLQLRNWEEKWKPDPLECDNAYSQEFCRRSWPHSGLWCWIRWSGSTQSLSMLDLWSAKASDKWGDKYMHGEKNIHLVAEMFNCSATDACLNGFGVFLLCCWLKGVKIPTSLQGSLFTRWTDSCKMAASLSLLSGIIGHALWSHSSVFLNFQG